MNQRKEIKEFFDAYKLWQTKGSPEMIPVISGKGPFSNKISLQANFRLFYLYDPNYVKYYVEVEE